MSAGTVYKVLTGLGALVFAGLGAWGAAVLIAEHNEKKVKDHDAQFQSKADADKHERDDIVAIKGLATKLDQVADSVNKLSVGAEMRQSWMANGIATINSKVDAQAVVQCHDKNPKDVSVCKPLEDAAAESRQEKVDSKAKAQDLTTKFQTSATQLPKEKP